MNNSLIWRAFLFLLGLILDMRWFEPGHIFDAVTWDNIGQIALIAALLIFVLGVIGTILEMLWHALVEKTPRRTMLSAATYRWLIIGSILHYLITLLLWRDAPSLFWAWLYGLMLLVDVAQEKSLKIAGLPQKAP